MTLSLENRQKAKKKNKKHQCHKQPSSKSTESGGKHINKAFALREQEASASPQPGRTEKTAEGRQAVVINVSSSWEAVSYQSFTKL